jgi:hypothetical protein
MKAGAQQAETDHAAHHEQARYAEVEEIQHAYGQRESHGDEGVNAPEHETVDELLRNHRSIRLGSNRRPGASTKRAIVQRMNRSKRAAWRRLLGIG